MGKSKLLCRAIRLLHLESEVLAGSEALQAKDGNLIRRADLVVVGGVGEGESKHALLLQVGFVDTSEGTDDDGKTTEVAGLKSSVLTGGAFTVVGITDDDPLDTLVAVLGGNLGNSCPLTSELVLDLVSLAVLSVDGTDKAVLCTMSA